MAKFLIPVANGVLSPEHSELISNPLGLFLWLIDKTTKEQRAADGTTEGLVLGGSPISYDDIAKVFGCSGRRVRRWKEALEEWGYIRTERTSRYGMLRWTVINSKKFRVPPKAEDVSPQTDEHKDVSPQTDEHKAEDVSPQTVGGVSTNGRGSVRFCPTQLDMQDMQDSTNVRRGVPCPDFGSSGAGCVETSIKDVSPKTDKHVLVQFVQAFDLAPHPLWESKMQNLLKERGEPAVLKAMENAKRNTWWNAKLKDAQNALAFFAKDSNFEQLLELKPERNPKYKAKLKGINLPGRGSTRALEYQPKEI